MSKHVVYLLSGAILMASSAGFASTPIPKESGFNGFVTFGAGSNRLSSNLVNGNNLGDFDNERIDNLTESPSSETSSNAFFNGEIRYTWADSRTQVVIGNSMLDFLRYDLATQIGVRQEIGSNGVIGIAYLLSSFPTRVWEDPYLTGANRTNTDRTSNGVRASWTQIMGSKFGATISRREVELDNEKSGQTLGLSAADSSLLDRNGTDTRYELTYSVRLAKGHAIVPAVVFHDRDRDGGAMRSTEVGAQLSYLYTGSMKWSVLGNLYVSSEEFDDPNPISEFDGKTRDDDVIGAALTVFYNEPFGWKQWRVMTSAAFFDGDSNIDFYQSNLNNVNMGLFYQF